LILSQLLTLYTTPVIYLFLDRFASKPVEAPVTEPPADMAAAEI